MAARARRGSLRSPEKCVDENGVEVSAPVSEVDTGSSEGSEKSGDAPASPE